MYYIFNKFSLMSANELFPGYKSILIISQFFTNNDGSAVSKQVVLGSNPSRIHLFSIIIFTKKVNPHISATDLRNTHGIHDEQLKWKRK